MAASVITNVISNNDISVLVGEAFDVNIWGA